MHEAGHYIKLEGSRVKCGLCPWNCILEEGQQGICRVRENSEGKLFTNVYNKLAALGTDPIEKKPLYHFYPGSSILSVGTVGCNLRCSFCQNHSISQCHADEYDRLFTVGPNEIVDRAINIPGNIGIAYTYNEPTIFYELMYDTARLAQKYKLKNVVVSNGYINSKPLESLLPFIDAFNIDLKSFRNEFYVRHTKGTLTPVLEVLKIISGSHAHLEITHLVIPGLNDSVKEFRSLIEWILSELGTDVPLHLSRYFPQYKMDLPPTPLKKLKELYDIARESLPYVYLGNVIDSNRSSTFCWRCGALIVERGIRGIVTNNLDPTGKCNICNVMNKIVL